MMRCRGTRRGTGVVVVVNRGPLRPGAAPDCRTVRRERHTGLQPQRLHPLSPSAPDKAYRVIGVFPRRAHTEAGGSRRFSAPARRSGTLLNLHQALGSRSPVLAALCGRDGEFGKVPADRQQGADLHRADQSVDDGFAVLRNSRSISGLLNNSLLPTLSSRLVSHFPLKVVHLFHMFSLAVLRSPSHIVNYAPGDVLACRLDAARNILCTFHCK